MKRTQKIVALALAALMVFSLAGCSAAPAAGDGEKTFKVGIIQLSEHPALDAASKGFQETLEKSGLKVSIEVQNAQGEQANCATIATKFVNDKVDLILAIATAAAQSAAQATKEIPILVTAVTDPAANGILKDNAMPGCNVSGTSDMNPIAQQVSLTQQLVPDAKTVGILYCSSEDNSILQAKLAQEAYEQAGFKVEVMTVADSNEIQSVTSTMCGKADVLYIPTDNLFASAMSTVSMVAGTAKKPVICGEGNMVISGGFATYGLNYYTLGKMTAEQAYKILAEGAKIEEMPVEYCSEAELEFYFNEETAKTIGLTIPAELAEKAVK